MVTTGRSKLTEMVRMKKVCVSCYKCFIQIGCHETPHRTHRAHRAHRGRCADRKRHETPHRAHLWNRNTAPHRTARTARTAHTAHTDTPHGVVVERGVR